jgi:hypothetical protein
VTTFIIFPTAAATQTEQSASSITVLAGHQPTTVSGLFSRSSSLLELSFYAALGLATLVLVLSALRPHEPCSIEITGHNIVVRACDHSPVAQALVQGLSSHFFRNHVGGPEEE